MKDETLLVAGVSTTPALPVESLTLAGTVALVAFGDHRRGLQPDRSDAWNRMSGLDPTSLEAQRLWDEWNRADIERSQKIRAAVRVLLHAITKGSLAIAGDLVTDGSPTGEIDTIRHDPIPADVLRLPAEIPLEWLENRGGWLLLRQSTVAGLHRHVRYTNISIAVADLTFAMPGISGTERSSTAPKDPLITRARSRHEQLVEALIQIHHGGTDINHKSRNELRSLALERAQIGERGLGQSRSTFERALAAARQKVNGH